MPHTYHPEAVDQAIAASNRAGRRIGGREARMIHALLRGHGEPRLQQRQHCYPVCKDPANFYYGRIVRLRGLVRVAGVQVARVSFGQVEFAVRAELLA